MRILFIKLPRVPLTALVQYRLQYYEYFGDYGNDT